MKGRSCLFLSGVVILAVTTALAAPQRAEAVPPPLGDESDAAPPGTALPAPPEGLLNTWGEGTPVPTGAQYQGAAVTIDNESFYLFGGYTTNYLNQCRHYSPATGVWTACAAMPVARGNIFAYFNPDDGLIYVPGGWDNNYRTENHRYDPATDTWEALAPLPIGKAGANGGIVDGTLYLFGGNGGASTNETQIYDIATNTWSTGSPMPVGTHRYGGNVTYEGHIYVMGAFDASHFLRYDPATDTWATGPNMTVVRNSPNCVVSDGGIIYCWGGGDQWNGRYNGEYYDLAVWPGGSWTAIDDDPIPHGTVRSGHACVGNQLWAVGGAPSPYHDRSQWWSGMDMTCYWPEDQPEILLVKTVGLLDEECAPTSDITVAAGTTVYYCFTVTNIGNVELEFHDLFDDQLGQLLTAFPFALPPGESVGFIPPGVVMTESVTNLATWTAYNTGPTDEASAQAAATVTVEVPTTATVTVEVGPGGGGSVSGGGVYNIGDFATVTATPQVGWVFLYWEVNGTQIPDNPYSFEVTEDITLTAVFQQIEAIPTLGFVGLALLLALLAGAGALIMRRM